MPAEGARRWFGILAAMYGGLEGCALSVRRDGDVLIGAMRWFVLRVPVVVG